VSTIDFFGHVDRREFCRFVIGGGNSSPAVPESFQVASAELILSPIRNTCRRPVTDQNPSDQLARDPSVVAPPQVFHSVRVMPTTAASSKSNAVGHDMSVILVTGSYDHEIRFWEAWSGICSRTIPRTGESGVSDLLGFVMPVSNVRLHTSKSTASRYPTSESVKFQKDAALIHISANVSSLLRSIRRYSFTTLSPRLQSPFVTSKGYNMMVIYGGLQFVTLEGHINNITSIAFNSEGKWIVSGSEDGTVKIWDLR